MFMTFISHMTSFVTGCASKNSQVCGLGLDFLSPLFSR